MFQEGGYSMSLPAVLVDENGSPRPCPEVLLPREAALYLRLDMNSNWEQTLKYYRERKILRGTRIGKRIYYTRKSLDEFLAKMTG